MAGTRVLAAAYVDPQKGVESVEAALEGARHIIAEINEDPRARDRMRALDVRKGIIRSQVATDKETEEARYRDYFDWNEPGGDRALPPDSGHAARRERGYSTGHGAAGSHALALLEDLFVNGDDPDAAQVRLALNDSYRRLLSRAMETELRLVTESTRRRTGHPHLRQQLAAAAAQPAARCRRG